MQAKIPSASQDIHIYTLRVSHQFEIDGIPANHKLSNDDSLDRFRQPRVSEMDHRLIGMNAHSKTALKDEEYCARSPGLRGTRHRV
jgi:hypothetical protein